MLLLKNSNRIAGSAQAVTLSLIFGLLQTASADISEAIAPLKEADLDSAKVAVASLEAISKDGSHPQQTIAATLGTHTKALFTAEHRLKLAIEVLDRKFLEARNLDLQGIDAMQPNTLGTINRIRAEEKFESAKAARNDAIRDFENALGALDLSAKEFSASIDLFTLKDQDIGILQDVAKTIESRSLAPAKNDLIRIRALPTRITAQIKAELEAINAQKQREKEDAEFRSMTMRLVRVAQKNKDYMTASELLRQLNNRGRNSGFLGNKNTREVHDLSMEKPNCHINQIEASNNDIHFTTLGAATSAGYDNCAHCIGDSKR